MRVHAPGLAVLSSLVLAVVSCDGPPPVECTTAIDCDVGEACRDGQCVDDGAAEGEGEGEEGPGDAAVIAAGCQRLVECGLGGVLEECVGSATDQVNQLRSIPDPSCTAAAEAFVDVYGCAADAPCQIIEDTSQGGAFSQFCPPFNQFQTLIGQCQGGEGEGEGEGECEGQFAFGGPEIDTVRVFNSFAGFDEVPSDACGGLESITFVIEAEGETQSVDGALISFDGATVFELLDVGIDAGGVTVRGTHCVDGREGGSYAAALLVDGLLTNSVCGFL